MIIKTSYLGNYRNYTEYTPICIMRWMPHYFTGYSLTELSPSSSLLSSYKNRLITFKEFSLEMENQLNNLSIEDTLYKIQCCGDKVVLVCTCKNYEICHRKIVADWINKQAKIIVSEIYREEKNYV